MTGYTGKWRNLRFCIATKNYSSNDFDPKIGEEYSMDAPSGLDALTVNYDWSESEEVSSGAKLFGKVDGQPVILPYPIIEEYTLNPATSTTLGGVIIGNGLMIDSNGVLSIPSTGGVTVDLSNHITNYRFAEAVETVYHAVWDELADWYIEASKVEANPAFMRRVLGITLRLVHPFAPFVTETIWTTIRGQESLLISQPWPSELKFSKTKAADFETIVELVNELRNIQGQLPNRKYRLVYDESRAVGDNEELIASLARLRDVKHDHTPHGLRIVLPRSTTWLELSDEEILSYKDDLQAKLDKLKNEIYALEKRLSNKGYIEKAPEKLVEETKRNLSDKKRQTTHIGEQLSEIS